MVMTMTGIRPAVAARDVVKVFGTGDARVRALDNVSVTFEAARFTAIMGPSGSGKSTLMHCLAGLESIDEGRIDLFDAHGAATDLTHLGDTVLTKLRRARIGFIFQSFNLLPTLTAAQNIRLPFELAGTRPDPDWYTRIVTVLGLADRLSHLPSQLSGGQQQRVACARALLPRPDVVFADEPTGNLDSRSGRDVPGFLRRSVDEFGQTVVMVTHDPTAASYADRAVLLADGRVIGDLDKPTAEVVLDTLTRLEG
jgi:putative ABC transport system ATP-binding protein